MKHIEAVDVPATMIVKEEIPWNDRCPRCRANTTMKNKYVDGWNESYCEFCGNTIVHGYGKL